MTESKPSQPTTQKSWRLLALLTFLISLVGSTLLLWFITSVQSETENKRLGSLILNQTSALIQPLILDEDFVSISHLLQKLADEDYISAVEFANQNKQTLSAGTQEGLLLVDPLNQYQQSLGTLKVWLNATPLNNFLYQQMGMSLLLILFSFGLTTVVLYFSFNSSQHKQQFSEKLDDLVKLLRPAPEQQRTEAQAPKFVPEPLAKTSKPQTEDSQTSTAEKIETPAAELALTVETKVEGEAELESENSSEQQLGLYSPDQELELLLSAEQASYLLYIDSSVQQDNQLSAEGKEQLIQLYYRLAQKVADIYQGEVELQAMTNISIRYDQTQPNDGHGVNATYASILLLLLHKKLNQQRQEAGEAKLELAMSLVRGNKDKADIVLEEARFLTRTTDCLDELISHTALTEAPDIKASLLNQADIRRESEDKVLIQKLDRKRQKLLEKQSNHLLNLLKQEQKSQLQD